MTGTVQDPIVLRVYGTPAPQGSTRARTDGKRTWVVQGGSSTGRASLLAWREAVATAARDWQEAHDAPLLAEPVRVEICFRLVKPLSTPKYKLYPDKTPDLDKLVRAVGDSLTGVVFKDDALIVDLYAAKVYGDPPGAEITITPLGAEELARKQQKTRRKVA